MKITEAARHILQWTVDIAVRPCTSSGVVFGRATIPLLSEIADGSSYQLRFWSRYSVSFRMRRTRTNQP
jgi:hypothetical protein